MTFIENLTVRAQLFLHFLLGTCQGLISSKSPEPLAAKAVVKAVTRGHDHLRMSWGFDFATALEDKLLIFTRRFGDG